MLYQPTNMFPSIFGSKGNGVIDASIDNNFTATIGGGGAVRAYQIIIYDNEIDTQPDDPNQVRNLKIVYDSGIVILKKQVIVNGSTSEVVDPFYPVDYTGKLNLFSVPVYVDESDMVNAHEAGYKWTLKVWENLNSAGDAPDENGPKAESVEQFFWTAITPTWAWEDASFQSVINTRSHVWKIGYSSNIEPERFKWYLYAMENGKRRLVDETEWIYDSSQIWYKNDGLISRTNQSTQEYSIRAVIVNRLGVQIDTDDTDLNIFRVEYDELRIEGATEVYQHKAGIKVGWGGIQRIEGLAVLKVDEDEPGNCTLDDDAGLCAVEDDSLLKFQKSDTFNVECNKDSDVALLVTVSPYEDEIKDIFSFTSDDGDYIRRLYHVGFQHGLRPDNDLDPGLPLVPSNGEPGVWYYYIKDGKDQFVTELTTVETLTQYNEFAVVMHGDGSFEVKLV